MLPELVAGRFAQEAGRAIKIVRSQADVGQNPSILRQAQNGAAQSGAGLTLGQTAGRVPDDGKCRQSAVYFHATSAVVVRSAHPLAW